MPIIGCCGAVSCWCFGRDWHLVGALILWPDASLWAWFSSVTPQWCQILTFHQQMKTVYSHSHTVHAKSVFLISKYIYCLLCSIWLFFRCNRHLIRNACMHATSSFTPLLQFKPLHHLWSIFPYKWEIIKNRLTLHDRL